MSVVTSRPMARGAEYRAARFLRLYEMRRTSRRGEFEDAHWDEWPSDDMGER